MFFIIDVQSVFCILLMREQILFVSLLSCCYLVFYIFLRTRHRLDEKIRQKTAPSLCSIWFIGFCGVRVCQCLLVCVRACKRLCVCVCVCKLMVVAVELID